MIVMDVRSAELTKYAANAMLATKISFMNEMANLCERMGADIKKVRVGIGSDPRIGYSFLYPGAGYGGSCFPKDVKALVHSAGEHGFDAQPAQGGRGRQQAPEAGAVPQDPRLLRRQAARARPSRSGAWRSSRTPTTCARRPARELMEALWQAGAKVRAYDPVAMAEAGRIYGKRDDLELVESSEAALDGADALAIVTEWQEFRSPDFERSATHAGETR